MINANDRVKNEFYVGPVYNYLIKDNGKVRIFDCKRMWGLGVPEDLDTFLKHYITGSQQIPTSEQLHHTLRHVSHQSLDASLVHQQMFH